MLVEIVLSYLSSDTQYIPENRMVANARTAKQATFRLPTPAIDHMRWLADARGITISQLTADMIVEYFNNAEAEDETEAEDDAA